MAGLALIISMGLTLFLGLIPPVEGELVYSINRDGIWWCGGAAVGYPPTMIVYNDSNVDGACFGYLRFVTYSDAEAEDLFKACQRPALGGGNSSFHGVMGKLVHLHVQPEYKETDIPSQLLKHTIDYVRMHLSHLEKFSIMQNKF